MKFNINENVKCVLTNYGEEILKEKGDVYYRYNYNCCERELSVQLWILMSIFGDDMLNGGRQLIVDNIIELERRDIKNGDWQTPECAWVRTSSH